MTPAVLDLRHLLRHTSEDGDLACEVLRLFVDQCARLGPEIAAAEVRRSGEAAHAIKGAAQAIGALRLAERADAFESEPAGPGREERRRELLGAMAQARRAAREALDEHRLANR